ncbi:MAG: DUF4392 domain-containing protein [Planctomycetes bacterium]|nr:DUF4392 domain-containing protein [Planctomycetota bacterium]
MVQTMKAPESASSMKTGGPAADPVAQPGGPAESNQQGCREIERLEQIITQDLAGRGLACLSSDNLVRRCRGNLARAARHLTDEGEAVAIATGFYVAHAERPAIETDGPCGAIALAWMLAELGCRVMIVTDPLGAPAITAGLAAGDVRGRSVSLEVFPYEDEQPVSPARGSNEPEESGRSLEFAEEFFRSEFGGQLTHLIAVERAGPSHWKHSQKGWTAAELSRFSELCPVEHHNQVHNYLGRIITPYTAKVHLLFEFVRENGLPVRTVGIGDGGNEIGMGSVPWPVLQANIRGGAGARIACRVPTDWTIACGVSNWGADALGAAVAGLRGRADLLNKWSDARERSVLDALVEHGAVDGITGRPEPSVDGMPLEQHLAIWGQMRSSSWRSD